MPSAVHYSGRESVVLVPPRPAALAVEVRSLTDHEGRQLQRIVRRGSTNSVRYRGAMMMLASAGGNRVPVIDRLAQADEDTVRGPPA
ncbi:hypothetical protein GCM10017778_32120 [Streptomyces vinaceus]|nr:hypothetical protein GCM10017778_32120 [Streptomyces vinaceus]